MKIIGFIDEVKIGRGAVVLAGVAKFVTDEIAAGLIAKFARSVADLTPNYVFKIWGTTTFDRHARFWTAPCPACDPRVPRITACAHCGNSRRVTFL